MSVGYEHRGDLGIQGREAFASPPETPRHHLYTVVMNTQPYWDHVLLRDYLRLSPDARLTYELVKQGAAEKFPQDIDAYIAAKSPFIEGILALAAKRLDQAER